MNVLTAISTGLAAPAALLSAVSAIASWRSTRAVEADVKLSQATTRYQLFRSFEDAYSDQYSQLWKTLGPWGDPVRVDETLRRTVHDLLQVLSSIHTVRRLGLIEPSQSSHVSELFLDWLRLPQAQKVWVSIFRVQADTWPKGFVDWVDAQMDERQIARS